MSGNVLALIAVLLLLGLVIANLSPSVERDPVGTITTEGDLDVFQIQLGDCFDDGLPVDEARELVEVAGLPCSGPHDNEVYAIFDVALPAFPGGEEMVAIADDSCLERFEAFVGRSYETSLLDILTLYPTRESWMQSGDRQVVCSVYHIDLQKLEGSARGSGI